MERNYKFTFSSTRFITPTFIGPEIGTQNSPSSNIIIGYKNSSDPNYGIERIAIGINVGLTGQENNTIAIGNGAGGTNQLSETICLGTNTNISTANETASGNALSTCLNSRLGGGFDSFALLTLTGTASITRAYGTTSVNIGNGSAGTSNADGLTNFYFGGGNKDIGYLNVKIRKSTSNYVGFIPVLECKQI